MMGNMGGITTCDLWMGQVWGRRRFGDRSVGHSAVCRREGGGV